MIKEKIEPNVYLTKKLKELRLRSYLAAISYSAFEDIGLSDPREEIKPDIDRLIKTIDELEDFIESELESELESEIESVCEESWIIDLERLKSWLYGDCTVVHILANLLASFEDTQDEGIDPIFKAIHSLPFT